MMLGCSWIKEQPLDHPARLPCWCGFVYHSPAGAGALGAHTPPHEAQLGRGTVVVIVVNVARQPHPHRPTAYGGHGSMLAFTLDQLRLLTIPFICIHLF